jgi:hypothetical protein
MAKARRGGYDPAEITELPPTTFTKRLRSSVCRARLNQAIVSLTTLPAIRFTGKATAVGSSPAWASHVTNPLAFPAAAPAWLVMSTSQAAMITQRHRNRRHGHAPTASIGTSYPPKAPELVPRDNGYSACLKSYMSITPVDIPIRQFGMPGGSARFTPCNPCQWTRRLRSVCCGMIRCWSALTVSAYQVWPLVVSLRRGAGSAGGTISSGVRGVVAAASAFAGRSW